MHANVVGDAEAVDRNEREGRERPPQEDPYIIWVGETFLEEDLRPVHKSSDGAAIWGKFVFREIVPPQRMVFINSFSDEAGGITRHPMSATWPLEMLSVFTFEEEPGGKTKVTIRWSPHNASEEERKTFDAGHDSMRQGWGGTMDQLAAYLAKA